MISFLGNRPRRSRIGLDLGASFLRAAQLERVGDVTRVTTTAICGRGEEDASTEEGPSKNRDHRNLGRRLQGHLNSNGLSGRSVNLGLSLPDLVIHALEIPKAILERSGPDADQVVRSEIERLVKDTSGGMETGYWTLPNTSASAPNVLGVAVGRDRVMDALRLAQEAKCQCDRVDSAAAALSRFGTLLTGGFLHQTDRVWGLLDLGARDARIVLCLGETPILARRAGTGGREWTRRIADALDVSEKTAEVHKTVCGIRPATRGLRQHSDPAARDSNHAPNSELASILFGALRRDLNDLAEEVKRSYEYALSCYPGKSAGDLILVGSGGLTKNLSEFLGRVLGIPVNGASEYLKNPECKLRFIPDKQRQLESLACAIGLACEF